MKKAREVEELAAWVQRQHDSARQAQLSDRAALQHATNQLRHALKSDPYLEERCSSLESASSAWWAQIEQSGRVTPGWPVVRLSALCSSLL